ncbi:hypothetical protein P3L10_015662 [Capsicum annuum]
MGAGGVISPLATYFDKFQVAVKKYDILFIADEVICSLERLGTMFGCDKYNIKHDLVSFAKVPFHMDSLFWASCCMCSGIGSS